MSEHDQHSSFIKTPKQLITVIVLAFLVPVVVIIMLVQLATTGPSTDPNVLNPDAVAARIQPAGADAGCQWRRFGGDRGVRHASPCYHRRAFEPTLRACLYPA